jgi:hypothetical protein
METLEPNRRGKRAALKNNHRNHVRQLVPSKTIWDDEQQRWIEIPSKVIFHKKKDNLPRLYPNMSKIKNRKTPTV